MQPWRSFAFVIPAAVVAALLLPAAPGFAATITVHCATQDLQKEIDAASAGSTLVVSGTCFGNFSVDKNLTLEGDPPAVLDGNGLGTTLTINGTPIVRLVDLTVTGGQTIPDSSGRGLGGGIQHHDGPLTLLRVSVTGNLAVGSGPDPLASGGGIRSEAGAVKLTDSSVTGNWAVASGSNSAYAVAGGIVSGGPLTLTRSVVSSNHVSARDSGLSSTARWGGVFLDHGTLKVSQSRIQGNTVVAVSAGTADAVAGGLAAGAPSTVTISHSTVSGNRVTASADAHTAGAHGGGLIPGTTTLVSDSTISGNSVTARAANEGGVAGGGGISAEGSSLTLLRSRVVGSVADAAGGSSSAFGGGIEASFSSVTLRLSSVSSNTLRAKAGLGGATAGGGGLDAFNSQAIELDRVTIDANRVLPSAIGGSTGTGGGIDTDGLLSVLRSTVSRNSIDTFGFLAAKASGGALQIRSGGAPDVMKNSTVTGNTVTARSTSGKAESGGGGLEVSLSSETLSVSYSTVVRNSVAADGDTNVTHGGGIDAAGGTTNLRAAILALNSSFGHPNCSGVVGSGGANVLGSVGGCTFQKKASDKVGVAKPKLGLLSANGGPTKTVPLLVGSPALNIILPASCAVPIDQRGTPRPQGPKCDAGAFER